jgi:hypothetical protein
MTLSQIDLPVDLHIFLRERLFILVVFIIPRHRGGEVYTGGARESGVILLPESQVLSA